MKGWSRRDWLVGALSASAGAGLLGWQGSRARASAAGSPRIVFVLEGNCVEPIAMLSPSARDAINPTLRAPIEGKRNWYRDYRHDALLSVSTPDLGSAKSLGALGSLASRSSVLYGLSNRAGGGGHSPHHGTLSCTRTVGGSPGGATIDEFLARYFSNPDEDGATLTPFDAIRVGVGRRPLNGGTCALGRGKPAAMLQNSTTAYQTYIGPVAGDMATERRRSMLAFAREDVEHAIATSAAGAVETEKLVDYRRAIERVEAQLETLASWPTDPAYLPARPEDDPRFADGAHFAQLGAQFSTVTSALRLGLTNVAVIGSATSSEFARVSYPSLARPGLPTDRHNLHHQSSGSSAHQDMIHEVSATIVQEIATMAGLLEATPDGDGATLLDNTLIVYLGDNGETHHSEAKEFPMLLVGGENLGFQHAGGRTLFYPGLDAAEHRRVCNMWMSIAAGAGKPINEFGGEDFTRIPAGELPGLRV